MRHAAIDPADLDSSSEAFDSQFIPPMALRSTHTPNLCLRKEMGRACHSLTVKSRRDRGITLAKRGQGGSAHQGECRAQSSSGKGHEANAPAVTLLTRCCSRRQASTSCRSLSQGART